MTGTAGIVMWLMMGLMMAAMAGGAIAWAKRRPRGHTAPQPQPQPPGNSEPRPDPASRDTPE